MAIAQRSALPVLVLSVVVAIGITGCFHDDDSSPNSPPTADDLSITTDEDTGINITLSGSDPDGSISEYTIASGPGNGSLSGTAPDLIYTPVADFYGNDSFTYTVTDNEGAVSSVATVTITVNPVNDAPVANADSFTAAGNTRKDVSAPGVLGNDTDVDGASLTATAGTIPTSNGGSVEMSADGSFIYTPPTGFSGDDSFNYEVNDNETPNLLSTGTVTITVGGLVWYVDNTAAAGGDGTSTSPFDTLAEAGTAASNVGDIIFVYAGDGTSTGMDGGISLLSSQQLVGEAAGLTVDGLSIPAGARPLITNSTGDGIILLGTNHIVRGFNLGSVIEPVQGAGVTGSGLGNLIIDTVAITSAGPAMDIGNASLVVSLDSLSASNSTTHGLRLSNVNGSFSVTGNTIITNPGDTGIFLSNTAAASLVFNGGTITDTGGVGIHGSNTGNLSIDAMTIQNTVGHNIGLTNAAGTVTITNSTLLDANEDGGTDLLDENNGIDIANLSGTLGSLTVSGNLIQGSTGTTSDVGIALHLDGTAVLSTATISGNTIQEHDFHAVRISLDNDDSGDAPVAALDVINNIVLSSEATAIELNARGASELNFTVSDNAQVDSDFGSGIHMNAGLFLEGGDSTATVTGSILNNTVTNVGDAANDRGLDILTQESSAAVVNIDGNAISNVTNGGIALRVRDTSSQEIVVNNNTLSNTDTFGGDLLGLFAETRETSAGCFAITNNTNALTYQLSQSAGTVFNLEPLVGNTGTVNTTGSITNVVAGTCSRVP